MTIIILRLIPASPADRSLLHTRSYAVPSVNPIGSEMSLRNFIRELTEQWRDDVVSCDCALERSQPIPSVLTAPQTLRRQMLHHTDGFPLAGGKKDLFYSSSSSPQCITLKPAETNQDAFWQNGIFLFGTQLELLLTLNISGSCRTIHYTSF